MKYFKIVILLLLIIVGVACENNEIKETDFTIKNKIIDNPFIIDDSNIRPLITFEHIKDVSLPAEQKVGFPYINQFLDTDTGFFLVTYFKLDTVLSFFDLETFEIIMEIPITKKGDVFGVNYVTNDSILLAYNPLYFHNNYNHDSSLIMINKTGEIIKNFLYDEAHVSGTKNGLLDYSNGVDAISDSLTFLTTFSSVYDYENKKIFFGVDRFKMPDYIGGDEGYFGVVLPFMGYEDLENEKFVNFDKVEMPYLAEGLYYPQNYYYTDYELLKDGEHVLISFPYTDLLYKYNYISEEIEHIKGFNSFFLDSIKVTTQAPKNRSYSNRFKYGKINYDKKNNQIIRLFHFPKSLDKTSLIISDENFNIKGEGIMPDGCDHIFYPVSEDTFVFLNIDKTANNPDSIYLSYYKINYQEEGIVDLTNELRSQFEELQDGNVTIKNYIEKVTDISDETYSVIIIPTSMSCPGCAHYTTEYFSVNYEILSKNPAYLLIADSYTTNGKNILKKYKLELDFQNIYFDSTNVYVNYHSNNMSNNPRLVLIENNKIILDKIYDADEMKKLQEDNSEFLMRNGFIKESK